MQDVLVAEPSARLPGRGLLLAGGVLLAAAAVAVPFLRDDAPPGPLRVTLTSLDGSALRGEVFVRLQLQVETDGAARLGEVRLLLAGTRALGQSPAGLHDGVATVQVDLVPPCPRAVQEYVDATLLVTVVDDAGRSRSTSLALPDDGPFERLVRYRCRPV